ncbi:protein-glutamine gamma-glutamyltransferase [Paenibacillus allorhizosphaerae]|uniref:Protein-glutamine gamma-glutamyltransferase n=1 Tax=Paenibacillus allorhizosphaerae TaxID=2849866 RepID=A0ABM8VMJ9_9BACL|nr:protein-glutamine gamma-glutamyltransferase [Paenibacillus allorhizosphaerae]CAG7650075.1 Protein-glutamine gamma-glutamyltransferase [Paenibacillus allorhizosphaerae]
MIIVAGGSVMVDPSGWTALEREIYAQKQASSKSYNYDSLEALRFELKLREAIVEASRGLDKSAAAFETFRKSRCNPAYWTRTSEGGFRLRDNVRPSDAIRDIYTNGQLYGFECATAIIIVLYKGVLETIGSDSFNRLFGDLYLFAWQHDSDLRLITEYNKSESYPGDVQYFKNPDVNPKVMEWQGENVIRMPGQLFFGHGIGIGNADKIIAKLNRHRKPGSTVSAYMLDESTYPNFFYLQQAAGGRMTRAESEHAELPIAAGHGVVARIGLRTMLYHLP